MTQQRRFKRSMRPVREQISIATVLVAWIALAITVVARRRRKIRAVPTGRRIARTDGNDFQRGEFRDSAFHGHGKMTYPDGTVRKGKWEEDDFVGSDSEEEGEEEEEEEQFATAAAASSSV